jgi:hypothetical protein
MAMGNVDLVDLERHSLRRPGDMLFPQGSSSNGRIIENGNPKADRLWGCDTIHGRHLYLVSNTHSNS